MRGELARFGPQAGLADAVERWPAAVGEAIARNAWPARIARDGTLHVATTDAIWAFELGHRAGEIAERLGVPAVRFAPGPLPRADEERAPEPAPAATGEQQAEAAALAAAVEDPDLRETVQRAALSSLLRAARDLPT